MSASSTRKLLPVTSAVPSHPVLKQKACISCKTRKVKCDRESPCNNCISWSIQCLYPSPIRRCRRPSKVADAGPEPNFPEMNHADYSLALDERLTSLETTFRQLSVAIGQPLPSTVLNTVDDSLAAINVLEEGVHQITSRFQSSGSMLHDSISLLTHPSSTAQPCHFGREPNVLHPFESQTRLLWQQFEQIADQQVKILHRPQAELILWRACTNNDTLSSGERALAFAIYFAALVGMAESVVEANFNMAKCTAITIYQQAAEEALLKSNLLSDPILIVVQAMTIFAAFSHYIEGDKRAWPLTGMARRLNPVASTFEGSPFEMEMRRRIWWALWYMDYRKAVNHGEENDIPIVNQVPAFPANVLDEDIHPDMVLMPSSRDSWTPVSFCLISYTISRTALQVKSNRSWNGKKILIDRCANEIQNTYLRHCTDNQLIHWLAKHVAHVHLTELRMKLYARNDCGIILDGPQSMERDHLVMDVTDILDVPSRLRNEPPASKWTFTLKSFPHFTHLSFLLNEISSLQIRPPPSQLWAIADQAYLRAESVMPASSKNKQLLRLSKSKAEGSMKFLLEWQHAADEVEKAQQWCNGTPGLMISVPTDLALIFDELERDTDVQYRNPTADAMDTIDAAFDPPILDTNVFEGLLGDEFGKAVNMDINGLDVFETGSHNGHT